MADDALKNLLEASTFMGDVPDEETMGAVHQYLIEVANEQGMDTLPLSEQQLMYGLGQLLLDNVGTIAVWAQDEGVSIGEAARLPRPQEAMMRFLGGVYCAGRAMGQRQAQEADADE